MAVPVVNALRGLWNRADMNTRLYTDDELAALWSMPKRVINPGARWTDKPGHRQRNFQVLGLQAEITRFAVYQRQNTLDESDFSCGISYLPHGGGRLTLARYNGPSHRHGDIVFRPHIHRATARAIAAGKKPESEAEETDRFVALDDALRCLIEDFDLEGLPAPQPDQGRLGL